VTGAKKMDLKILSLDCTYLAKCRYNSLPIPHKSPVQEIIPSLAEQSIQKDRILPACNSIITKSGL
jgi:hypothetical protein